MATGGPRLLHWSALAVLAVSLAACSDSPQRASSSTASAGSDSTTSRPNSQGANSNSWAIESVDSTGATWTTKLTIAGPIAGNALKTYSALYGNPCNLNRKTDAIVPFQITTTSTAVGGLAASGDQKLEVVNASLGGTPNGSDSAKGAQGTQSSAGLAAGEVLMAAKNWSSGPTCANLDPPGETMTLGNESLTNGQKMTLKGYFDLQHWADPGSQSGDVSWLHNIWVLVPNHGNLEPGKDWETSSVSGPAVVSLLDYTPTLTYNPSDSYDKKNIGYGWAFPIDGHSQPDCIDASSTSPRGSSMPSLRSLCEALPEEVVLAYLNNHKEITDAGGRSLTGITSERVMRDIFSSLQKKGEIEMVPGARATWRKKAPQ